MKTKKEIVRDWLPRYTGTPLEDFGKYILLVNFSNYVHMFAEMHGTRVCCEDKPMPNASADGITIINFGMGSANAATVMDLLSAIHPGPPRHLDRRRRQARHRRVHPANSSHSRRRRIQRLFSA